MMKLTRSRFEQLVDPILTRSGPVETALKDAGRRCEEDRRGSAGWWFDAYSEGQEIVKEMFGKEPNKSVNPDEV